MLRLIIFDCDGVLFHSDSANLDFFNTVLERIGQPRLDSAGERMAKVMAGTQLIEALLGHDRDLVRRASEVARSLDYRSFLGSMQPVPGLYETLASLRQTYRLAMASNRGTSVPLVMGHFGLDRYLELAVGTTDVERPKPAPDMLEKCLLHFEVASPEALYVGDAPSDFQAAQAAGMHFLGVGSHTGGENSIDALPELSAWLVTAKL